VVTRNSAGRVVLELGKKIARETNNVAECYALLAALLDTANNVVSKLKCPAFVAHDLSGLG